MQVCNRANLLRLSGWSHANVCGDLALFTTIRKNVTSRLDFANGTTEYACIRGSVLCVLLTRSRDSSVGRRRVHP
jgi:hypothetical protein